jgi:hypothetical protein
MNLGAGQNARNQAMKRARELLGSRAATELINRIREETDTAPETIRSRAIFPGMTDMHIPRPSPEPPDYISQERHGHTGPPLDYELALNQAGWGVGLQAGLRKMMDIDENGPPLPQYDSNGLVTNYGEIQAWHEATGERKTQAIKSAVMHIMRHELVPTSFEEAKEVLGAMFSLDRERLMGAEGALIPELLLGLTGVPGALQAMRDVGMDVIADEVGGLTLLAGAGAIPLVGVPARMARRFGKAYRVAQEMAEAGDHLGAARHVAEASVEATEGAQRTLRAREGIAAQRARLIDPDPRPRPIPTGGKEPAAGRVLGASPAEARMAEDVVGLHQGGGSTTNIVTGEHPTEGFVVAAEKARNKQFDRAIDQADIGQYVNANREALEKEGYFLGTWLDEDTGITHLDVVRIFDNRADAMRLGRELGEKAIFDLSKFEDIPVTDEMVANAAIKIRATGEIVEGPTHADAIHTAQQTGKLEPGASVSPEIIDADLFRTTDDRIVPRAEAEALQETGARARATAEGFTQPAVAPVHPESLAAPVVRERTLRQALAADEAEMLAAVEANPRMKAQQQRFTAAEQAMPAEEVMAAGALAGRTKRGWYRNSTQAIVDTFGPDAPRFAALLAALSPQAEVPQNLEAALKVWNAWEGSGRIGRRGDIADLDKLLNDVMRATPEGGMMDAHRYNAIRALTADDPVRSILSGPKVSSFHQNLMGDVERVTIDTWQSRLAGINEQRLSRGIPVGAEDVTGAKTQSVPTSLYAAYSGRHRQTADYLTRMTGQQWTPEEVQETLWSWGKALTEYTQDVEGIGRKTIPEAGQLIEQIGVLPEEVIRAVPDFSRLMREAPYAELIEEGGRVLPTPRALKTTELGGMAVNRAALEELATNIARTKERGNLLIPAFAGAVGANALLRKQEEEPRPGLLSPVRLRR